MEKKRPKVGMGVFVIKNNKFLIGKRINSHGHNTWCLPGGHLEYMETFEECAKRETLEESSINIKNVEIVGVTNDLHKKEDHHYVTIFVKSTYVSEEAKIMEKNKCAEWRWITLKELPIPLFLPLESFLNQTKDINQKLFYSS